MFTRRVGREEPQAMGEGGGRELRILFLVATHTRPPHPPPPPPPPPRLMVPTAISTVSDLFCSRDFDQHESIVQICTRKKGKKAHGTPRPGKKKKKTFWAIPYHGQRSFSSWPANSAFHYTRVFLCVQRLKSCGCHR